MTKNAFWRILFPSQVYHVRISSTYIRSKLLGDFDFCSLFLCATASLSRQTERAKRHWKTTSTLPTSHSFLVLFPRISSRFRISSLDGDTSQTTTASSVSSRCQRGRRRRQKRCPKNLSLVHAHCREGSEALQRCLATEREQQVWKKQGKIMCVHVEIIEKAFLSFGFFFEKKKRFLSISFPYSMMRLFLLMKKPQVVIDRFLPPFPGSVFAKFFMLPVTVDTILCQTQGLRARVTAAKVAAPAYKNLSHKSTRAFHL